MALASLCWIISAVLVFLFSRSRTGKVFNGDLKGPDGAKIEVYTARNGSFESLVGSFVLEYGVHNRTWPLPFNASADEVENALEVGIMGEVIP